MFTIKILIYADCWCQHVSILKLQSCLYICTTWGIFCWFPPSFNGDKFILQHEKFCVSSVTNQRYLYLFAYLCIFTKAFPHFKKLFDISEWKLFSDICLTPERRHSLDLLFPSLEQNFIATLSA